MWHQETELPALDLIGVPGGFSYGDYLRCGAIAARSPVMREVVRLRRARAARVLGICNGFQILTEAGLLPGGADPQRRRSRFVCRMVELEVDDAPARFTQRYAAGQRAALPVAHHDGNYVVDDDDAGAARGRGPGRLPLRASDIPNGSTGRHRRRAREPAATCWA